MCWAKTGRGKGVRVNGKGHAWSVDIVEIGTLRGRAGYELCTHIQEADEGGDVVLVVLDGFLARLSYGLEGGDVDDTPDLAPLVFVVVEDGLDVLCLLEVALEALYLGVGLVLFGSVSRQLMPRDL